MKELQIVEAILTDDTLPHTEDGLEILDALFHAIGLYHATYGRASFARESAIGDRVYSHFQRRISDELRKRGADAGVEHDNDAHDRLDARDVRDVHDAHDAHDALDALDALDDLDVSTSGGCGSDLMPVDQAPSTSPPAPSQASASPATSTTSPPTNVAANTNITTGSPPTAVTTTP